MPDRIHAWSALALAALLSAAGSAGADPGAWESRGKPVEVCDGVQRNVRYMYNALGNGATQTYAEMKAHMRSTLGGKGEPESRLLAVYEEALARIEAGEFSPPRTTPGEGQLAARNAAGALCLKAFPDR
jgi:hypothetical protein